MIMNILFHNVELLHSSVTLVKTPVQILLGMLTVEFISLITSLILVSEPWITIILAKDTVAQYAVITRSIFLPYLVRFWIILFARNPGD